MWTKTRLVLLLAAAWTSAHAAPSGVYIVHDTPQPMTVLARYLERHGHPTVAEDQKRFRAHMRQIRPEAIFMYIHAAMDDDIENYLIEYAEGGGRLIIVHHGIASGRMKNKRWMDFLGVRIQPRDDPGFPWAVLRGDYHLVKLNPAHPVTSNGVTYPETVVYTSSDAPALAARYPAIELRDTELFLNQIFTDGRAKTVLLGMKGIIGGKTYMQDRAGWTMPKGKGQVFYFMPGHEARDFEDPNYARILLNAVEWSPARHNLVAGK